MGFRAVFAGPFVEARATGQRRFASTSRTSAPRVRRRVPRGAAASMPAVLPSKKSSRLLSLSPPAVLLALCFPNVSVLRSSPSRSSRFSRRSTVCRGDRRSCPGSSSAPRSGSSSIPWIAYTVHRFGGVRLAARGPRSRDRGGPVRGPVRPHGVSLRGRPPARGRGSRRDVRRRVGRAGGLPDLRLGLRRLPLEPPREPARGRPRPPRHRRARRRVSDVVPRRGPERGALRRLDEACPAMPGSGGSSPRRSARPGRGGRAPGGPRPSDEALRVGVVQPNVEQDLRWDARDGGAHPVATSWSRRARSAAQTVRPRPLARERVPVRVVVQPSRTASASGASAASSTSRSS